MCSMLQINEVSFSYKNKRIFSNLDFSVEKGDKIAVLGHNGAGKTTLLKIIAGLIKIEKGTVTRNFNVANMAYMNEELGLYPFLSGKDNLKMILLRHNISLDNTKIKKLTEIYQLQNDINIIVNNYSTGMKRKLSLLGVLLTNPELFLLDEPFTGIDPVSLDLMIKQINETSNNNNACIIVNHDLASTKKFCNKFIIIKEGKIVYSSNKKSDIDNLEEIYTNYS